MARHSSVAFRRHHWPSAAAAAGLLMMTMTSLVVMTSTMSAGGHSWRSATLSSSYRRRDLQTSSAADEPLNTRGRMRMPFIIRRTALLPQCISANGRCFSTPTCCRGLVCADIDLRREPKPETPGYCVREKDLQACTDSDECLPDFQCLEMSPGEQYCLPRSTAFGAADAATRPGDSDITWRQFTNSRVAGGLGAACESTDDCNIVTDGGSRRLCCQVVRRGRLQPKKMCDRVTSVSACIVD